MAMVIASVYLSTDKASRGGFVIFAFCSRRFLLQFRPAMGYTIIMYRIKTKFPAIFAWKDSDSAWQVSKMNYTAIIKRRRHTSAADISYVLLGEIILFIPALIFTIIATVYGIIFAQKAFQIGQVNLLSPLIGVPGQIIPVMIYFLVFNLITPSYLHLIFLIIGLSLILLSSFLLGTKQVKLEEITK